MPTGDLLECGRLVSFAERAWVVTYALTTWTQFVRQRQRGSRGPIDAFKSRWRTLFKPRLSTLFIGWKLLFPHVDLMFRLSFVPAVVLALFGVRRIAGPLTLFLLPLAAKDIMLRIRSRKFTQQGLHVRRNVAACLVYAPFTASCCSRRASSAMCRKC